MTSQAEDQGALRNFCYAESVKVIAQISPRGQVTLPVSVRKALGLKPGDALLVRVEEGRVVLEPAQVLPLEAYTEERPGVRPGGRG